MAVTLLQTKKVVIPPWITDETERTRINSIPAIDYIMEWFDDRIPPHIGGTPNIPARGPQDRILIIRAGTGSGKSTSIPPELYARYVGKKLGAGRSIGVTQPRVLTAIGKAMEISRIPSMNFLRFGENLGYQTGIFLNKPIRGLVFVTIGVISHHITYMEPDVFMNKYSIIVLDECHERSIPLDIAMYKLREFIHTHWRDPRCPFLILTSATFDVHKYARYFGVPEQNIYDILGFSKPIAAKFPITTCADWKTDTMKKIISIHEGRLHDFTSDQGRDIIVFVSTGGKMKDLQAGIDKYNTTIAANHKSTESNASSIAGLLYPIQLTSEVYHHQGPGFRDLYRPYESLRPIKDLDMSPTRKVILATPVAETGITIKTVKYVIDLGLHMSPEYNPVYHATIITDRPVTQNMAIQRKGRVGRLFPGEWHPMYTKDTFDSLVVDSYPDMMISLPDEIMLSIILDYGIEHWDGVIPLAQPTKPVDFSAVKLLDPLPPQLINAAVQKFYALGLLTADLRPTIKSLLAIKFSHLDVETACMMLSGFVHGANMSYIITIAAFMAVGLEKMFGRDYSSRNPFASGDDHSATMRDRYKIKAFVGCEFIDLVLLYEEAYDLVSKIDDPKTGYAVLKDWCASQDVNYDMFKNVFIQRDSIINSMLTIGINPNTPTTASTMTSSAIGQQTLRSMLAAGGDKFDMAVGEIKRIKRCLVSGYMFNIAIWQRGTWINKHTGHTLAIRSQLIEPVTPNASYDGPRMILYQTQVLRKKPFPGQPFKFSATRISILSGFVDTLDEDYLLS